MKTSDRFRDLYNQFRRFERECRREEYTDTDVVWELMPKMANGLRAAERARRKTESVDETDKRLRGALAEFVSTVDATGGAVRRSDGTHVPDVDHDWIDLGEAYVRACEALGWKAKVYRIG